MAASVVILVIDEFNIRRDKAECDAPVSVHPDGPEAFSRAFQRMQAKYGLCKIFQFNRAIQGAQSELKFCSVSGLYSTNGTRFVKEFQAFVSKADDHKV